MAAILGRSRVLFSMARQRVIPGSLAAVSKKGVPTLTVMVNGAAIALIIMVSQGNIELLASIFSFGTLMTFFFINFSLLQLRQKMPEANRTFKVPLYPVLPILGMISCFALMLYLKPNAIIAAGVWIAIGVGCI